jgi:hypothetical protein
VSGITFANDVSVLVNPKTRIARGSRARSEHKAHMHGRRSHARFIVASNEGVLNAAWDVVVVSDEGTLFAFSGEPAIVGDLLTIELIIGDEVEHLAVRVEESLPMVDAGMIRHRIRLRRVDAGDARLTM